MRWSIFFIFAFVLLALEVGLRPLWVLPVGPFRAASPSLLLVLGVYISLNTTAGVVISGMIVLGMLTDLTQPVGKTEPIRDVILLGPGALGFLLGGLVTLRLRSLVFRDSAITLMVMTFTVGLFVQLATVGIIAARSMLPTDAIPGWMTTAQLLQRSVCVIYSAVIALPLGLLLIRTRRTWQFHSMRNSSMVY